MARPPTYSMLSDSEPDAMTVRICRLTLIALIAAASGVAGAADLFVIAHPEVRLSRAEVVEVFRGNRQFAGDVMLQPVDNASARGEFVSRALGIDEVRYESHWTRKSFREGLLPPPLKSGDRDVASFVMRTPGAIGYVHQAPEGANIIARY